MKHILTQLVKAQNTNDLQSIYCRFKDTKSGWETRVSILVFCIDNLLVVLFAVSLLFGQQSQRRIHMAAQSVIVFSSITLLWIVITGMGLDRHGYAMNTQSQIFSLMAFLPNIATIVLASAYLPGTLPSLPEIEPVKEFKNEDSPVVAPIIEKQPEKVRPTVYSSAAQAHYYLEHRSGSMYHKKGEQQRISAEQVEIGRDPGCDIRYDEHYATVSRRHAAIVRDGNHWKLTPISQTNSTYINGHRVHNEWYLQNNDEIQCALNGPVLVFKTMC